MLIMVLALGACSDDFLESEPTELISTDQMSELKDQNPEIFNGTIRGLYAYMYTPGSGGTKRNDGVTPKDDDLGQKGYDIFSDMLCGDMILAGYNYGHYKNIAQMTATTDYTDLANYKTWRYYYRIIRAANVIIDGLGGNDAELTDPTQKSQMGQAKTMRAYSYFYLAYFFTEEYDPNEEILPLYQSATDRDMPLSKSSEIWATIKSDLEASVDLLEGASREGLHGVNQDVANGLLAYTYLTMGEYDKAAATAQKVIDAGYQIVPKDKVAGSSAIPRNAFSYIDGDGADWIWGMDLTLDQGLDLISWWGQVDIFTYSYAGVGDAKTIDTGLFNSIPDTDERKKWVVTHPWYGIPNCPGNKFYHEQRSVFTQREVTTDYVYMRVEEMVLIKAEAEAFAGKEDNAKTTLKTLVSQRNSDVTFIDALSGQDLKDEIYHQWRIEMWGEGKSYLAMKRNKATITREGHIDFNVSIDYNDDRLTFDIPRAEIQDNPNINL
ncbi:RagB/SusD family nutrient uptake outer membrane protein [Puteibacter caeruleilacunae]|nr:RagB/SusD family nutrient uptake outer membrane protein [Puteibacter caeruleilacunae]